MITFDVQWVLVLALVVTIVLPILTGLVTTRVTSSKAKAVVLALLAAVTGLGTELLLALQNGTPYDLFVGLVAAVGVFAVAVAMHFGLWKPTGVSEKAQSVSGFVR